MKFKTHGIILSLFFVLGLVFSFSIAASATHGDSTITAQEVAADPGNEQKMKELLNRVVNYYEHVRAENMDDRAALIRGLTVFARDIRREGGYKHDDIYVIDITGRNVVTNHAGYPERIGYKFNPDASNSAIASTIQDLIDGSEVGMPHCENYDQNTRVACATKVEETITGSPVTNIVGLRHDIDDSAFIPPDCEGLSLGTTAKEVYDDPTDANLEAYVKDVIGAVQEDIKDITVDELEKLLDVEDLSEAEVVQLVPLGNPTEQQKLDNKVKTRIQERLFCFGSEDKGFKHKNIYVFMMDADPAHSTVLFNGNSFDLNGGNLKLKDYSLEGNDKTIAGLFNRELAGETSAYANYRWDDPLDMEDEIEKWFERDLVPGSSPKRSYIEVADLNKAAFEELASLLESLNLPLTLLAGAFPKEHYIFGSGVYPDEPNMPHMMDAVQDDMTDDDMTDDDMTDDDMTDDDMTDDDMTKTVDAVSGGGCTIAGTSNTSQGTLLNLFLMASVLFSVVFLRRRA